MDRFAVLDIGSNSVRLMFVADGKVLYKRLQTTRLGEGIATAPFLKTEAIERTARAVADFHALATKQGAQHTFVFATAAVRSAKNGDTFVSRVKELCGLIVDVVDGEREARLGLLGALKNQDGAVIDVGGASTELVVRTGGEIVYKKSVDIGVVRLKDKCGRDKNALLQETAARVKEYGVTPKICEVYAIGGTATTLAAVKLGLQEYSSEKITGTEISAQEMQAWADKLLLTPVEEIAKMPCMPAGRADVLAGGALWLAVMMKTLGVEKCIVSDCDNLEGYAIERGLME
ncbi:MAG: hypothetical protein IJA89_04625 [Clostridia bacterium]|nr:hypothetical protein [Clostridia bacterium]